MDRRADKMVRGERRARNERHDGGWPVVVIIISQLGRIAVRWNDKCGFRLWLGNFCATELGRNVREGWGHRYWRDYATLGLTVGTGATRDFR